MIEFALPIGRPVEPRDPEAEARLRDALIDQKQEARFGPKQADPAVFMRYAARPPSVDSSPVMDAVDVRLRSVFVVLWQAAVDTEAADVARVLEIAAKQLWEGEFVDNRPTSDAAPVDVKGVRRWSRLTQG